MLARYALPEMVALWSEQRRQELWCRAEVALAQAQSEQGVIPQRAAEAIAKHAHADEALVQRSREQEKETRHDVTAFLRALEERIEREDKDAARFLHFGVTSSDILDSAFAMQLLEATHLLEQGLTALLAALRAKAVAHKRTLCLGRSHGMAAEPTTFGLKLLSFYAEGTRARQRLQRARLEIATVSFSGTVGHYAFLSPDIEQRAAALLTERYAARWGGIVLACEPCATQVIPRDRHAMLFATFAITASFLERLAVEIRHLQRSEVAEVCEAFADGQTGSSAMPHKQNPILSENITGLARLLRMPLQAALENIALWHERDISHSSVERVIAPDSCTTLDFALQRTTSVVENLQVFPQRMQDNLEAVHGTIFSQGLLIKLVQKGLSRKQAYGIVQRASRRATEQAVHLFEALQDDAEAQGLFDAQEKAMLQDLTPYTRHVDTLFERVLAQ